MSLSTVPMERRTPPSVPVSVVYILGAGHSGSTLLATLLGGHPRIATIGEVKAPALGDLSRYRCSCGEEIAQCRFWRDLAREIEALGSRLELGNGATDVRRAGSRYVSRLLKPLHRGPALELIRDAALSLSPAWHAHLRRVQALTAALPRAVCTVTGRDIFVDSSKTGLQLKYLLRNPGVDVRVVRLIRDGRGVAHSYRKAEGLTIAAAAHIWRRSNEESEAIVAELGPDRWIDVRYEDLCRDLDATMRRIFSFVGVEPVATAGARPAQQHVLGNNKMRLNGRRVRLDEAWRTSLSSDDLQVFDGMAGRLNRRFGYG